MENLRILNKKEKERILNKIKDLFGVKKLNFDYGMLQNKHGKIFLISNDIIRMDLSKLRINELGLYVARLDNELRLTIEGSQLFGEYATKNIYEVNDEEANSWLQGNDIACNKEFNDFVIIKYKNNYLGSGK
jgi:NOL1/NOP2/fmu family ribosome biogenesis protein